MTVRYAGVALNESAPELEEWLAQNLQPRELFHFSPRDWPAPIGRGWARALTDGHPPPVKVGTLTWPWGASRWATSYHLASSRAVDQIRPRVYQGSLYLARNLVVSDGQRTLTAPMHLLPPYPLSQITGSPHLWLLTLVDVRYFWWQKAADVAVTEATTTWAGLFALIGAALGETLTHSAVPADFLSPPEDFVSSYEWLPPLLDACAASVGRRVVRSYAGAVEVLTAAEALARKQVSEALRTADKAAGGHLALAAT